MGREEQIEEREVLASIFPDEITDISETTYRVSIALDVPGQDAAAPPTIHLTITYPPTYPSIPPSLTLTLPRHAHLFPDADTPSLLDSLQSSISESLGEAMVFTLISALKDNAEQLIVDRLREVERVQERAKRREEEEEQRKFEGEKVTRESFGRWRGRFMAEVEGEREEGKAKGEGKLTGRQLWEGGLVGRGEEDDGEGAKELVGGVERPGVGE